MIEYLESEDLQSVTGDGKTVPKVDGGYWEVVQKQVIDGDAFITPFIGSDSELAQAIALKQAEIAQHFKWLHGYQLVNVNAVISAPQPALTFNPNTITNAGIADVEIIFVGALLNKASVDAYDVINDPNWV